MSIYDQNMPMLPPYRVMSTVSIMAEAQDYNHKMLNIPAMWRRTKGAPVPVVILDTGLPNHFDLHAAGAASFIPGYLNDKNGHSTHVGGIIAAIANNDMGVAGIAPECMDYYGAVLDGQGSGNIDAIIKGIRWAVDVVGARVINMSLGIQAGVPRLKELEAACNYAASNGAIIVAASGNEAGAVGQPAIYDSVIAVAAVDQDHKHAWFSNVGKEVDFATGGVKVYSTWLNNSYAKLDGTSMATPALAGVIALIQADHYARAKGWLSFQEVYDKLKKIAFDVGSDGFDNTFGHGIPIFRADDDTPVPPPLPPSDPPPVDPEPPIAPPPSGKDPCDCTLAVPLVSEFFKGAGGAVEQGVPGIDAIGKGLLAAKVYFERHQAVLARQLTRGMR